MIDKICNFLTNRIRKEMPDIDDERAEVINYGLQNIVGERYLLCLEYPIVWEFLICHFLLLYHCLYIRGLQEEYI